MRNIRNEPKPPRKFDLLVWPQNGDGRPFLRVLRAGYLDHALASTSMAGQVTDASIWHINADEPSVLDYNTEYKSAGQVISLYAPDEYRSSDHDPVITA